MVANFGHIAQVVGEYGDEMVLKELFQGFKKIVEHYHLPNLYNGRYSDADFDFYRFIGDELFTTLVSVLLREQKWGLVKNLLEYRLVVTNTGSQRSETVDFNYIGHFYLESFAARDKRLGRLSARADLLSQRHESLPIKQFSSIADYTSADFFLFLRGKRTGGDALGWKMWSSVYLKEPPNFLIAAESKKIAEEVMALLEFKDIEEV